MAGTVSISGWFCDRHPGSIVFRSNRSRFRVCNCPQCRREQSRTTLDAIFAEFRAAQLMKTSAWPRGRRSRRAAKGGRTTTDRRTVRGAPSAAPVETEETAMNRIVLCAALLAASAPTGGELTALNAATLAFSCRETFPQLPALADRLGDTLCPHSAGMHGHFPSALDLGYD
jgi:hypothetical protein